MTTSELRRRVSELYDDLDNQDNRGEYDPATLNKALRETLSVLGQTLDIMSRAGAFSCAALLKGGI